MQEHLILATSISKHFFNLFSANPAKCGFDAYRVKLFLGISATSVVILLK